ncbi:hypothetical protein BD779DRAFT_1571573 [Infundibulicybe gibba]|nr:hypothetical protein BD779DRAFT_1571573 [Infundibulicybe gibba]
MAQPLAAAELPTHATTGTRVDINVPAGWYSTITAISRKPYNQLVRINHTSSEMEKNYYISKSNETMQNTLTGVKTITLIAQTTPSVLSAEFFYAKDQALSGIDIAGEQYRSSNVQVVTFFSESTEVVGPIPDYKNFIVFVEDSSDLQGSRDRAYDDLVFTVHFSRDITMNIPAAPRFDFENIQGDLMPGLPKAFQHFYFFKITDASHFRKGLEDFVIPNIATAHMVRTTKLPPPAKPDPEADFVGLNVSFSATGLAQLGIMDDLHDESFHKGQKVDAEELGDPGVKTTPVYIPNWDHEFQSDIHGVFLITSHSDDKADEFIKRLDAAFSRGVGRSSIRQVLLFRGNFRPPPDQLNEHFGYRDGISQTQIKDVTYSDTEPMKFPGSPTADMGVIVMGYEGDEDVSNRPAWTKDGSFMVFRKLKTFVPEFRRFLIDEGRKVFPNLPPEQASNLYGARLFGRWKSGTPIVLSPDEDRPEIAADPEQVNNFDYSGLKGQSVCPFAAHTRKSNPREGTAEEQRHMIRRQSIAYGPELMDDELQQEKTLEDRGLILVCYQSSIVRGFKYIQQSSYNNPNYPAGDKPAPGYDAINGQTGLEQSAQPVHRFISGMDPTAQTKTTTFPIQFIESNGGEYFFVPSISALKDIAADRTL